MKLHEWRLGDEFAAAAFVFIVKTFLLLFEIPGADFSAASDGVEAFFAGWWVEDCGVCALSMVLVWA